jgi:hypothetical protein
MDPLAEMHLLLREHGWEPRFNSRGYRWMFWKWTRPGCDWTVVTVRDYRDPEDTRWQIVYGRAWRSFSGEPRGFRVAGLRRRLEELAPPDGRKEATPPSR